MIRTNLLEGVMREPVEAAPKPASLGVFQARAFVAALVISGLLVVGAHTLFSRRLDGLNRQMEAEKRQAAALAEIQAVNTRYTAELQDIQRRLDALQILQDKRQSPGAFMTQLANYVNGAPGLYLVSVAPQGGRIALNGTSASVNAIAVLLRTLQASDGFKDVQLHEFYEDDDKDGQVSFKFIMDFAYSERGTTPPSGQAAANKRAQVEPLIQDLLAQGALEGINRGTIPTSKQNSPAARQAVSVVLKLGRQHTSATTRFLALLHAPVSRFIRRGASGAHRSASFLGSAVRKLQNANLQVLRYQLSRYSRFGLWTQALFVIAFLLVLRLWPLVPGIGVAFLGLDAVVVTVRHGYAVFGQAEQVTWLVIALVLLIIEIRASYSSRDTLNRERVKGCIREDRVLEAQASREELEDLGNLIQQGAGAVAKQGAAAT